MAKDSLWSSKLFGKALLALGAFPVHRESADREALLHAEAVLKAQGVLILFPEGGRRTGKNIETLLEGAAFLSCRTGAPIVPVGFGNSERAMKLGNKLPRPLRICITIGPAIPAPQKSEAGRVRRSQIHAMNEVLQVQLQSVFDSARKRAKEDKAAPLNAS